MAVEVDIRSFVTLASVPVGGKESSPQTATGHIRNRYRQKVPINNTRQPVCFEELHSTRLHNYFTSYLLR